MVSAFFFCFHLEQVNRLVAPEKKGCVSASVRQRLHAWIALSALLFRYRKWQHCVVFKRSGDVTCECCHSWGILWSEVRRAAVFRHWEICVLL